MTENLTRIQQIANKWKNWDPDLYRVFLAELDKYTFDVTVAVTEAPPADILQAQGRAKQARKFMQAFSETLEEKPNYATSLQEPFTAEGMKHGPRYYNRPGSQSTG